MPQGSVISPLLFIFFVADLNLDTAEINEAFADDFHAAACSPDIAIIESDLNETSSSLVTWTDANNMFVSAPKSTATLFTPWTKQVDQQLNISIKGVQVPTVKNPKLLGVVLDPLLTFNAHAASVAKKCASRLNLLRALGDTSFGHDKEVLLSTFKSYIRSVTDYGAPIVFPNYSASSINRLQRIQNRALRLALGCHNMASVDHLHAEAQELPVGEHMRLLSAQYLARALQPGNPSHPYVTRPDGRRKMKHTLRSKVIDDVRPYLDADGKIVPGTYRDTLNSIHTDIVGSTIAKQRPNRVLNTAPPKISMSEKTLPRVTRSTLSQLRSGFCSKLNDFRFRIGQTDSSACPECHMGEHNVSHLFDCPRHPTSLSPLDLWRSPRDVADFLFRIPSFSSLPRPPPLPLRGHRRGRPPDPPPPPAGPSDGNLNDSDSSLFSSLSLPSDFLSSSSSSLSSSFSL